MTYSMTAVGDIMMAAPFQSLSKDRDPVGAVLRDADHCLVNLELPLTHSVEQADKVICLKANPALASELRRMGADVATFANNHSMDFGVAGLRDTLDALDHAGIIHVGAGMTLAASLKPAMLSTPGGRVAFVGVAATLPNGSGAGPNRPGVAPIRVLTRYVIDPVTIDETPGMSAFAETVVVEGDRDLVLEAVRTARAECDLLIVTIHWGVPYGFVAPFQDELADYQRPLGRALIDAGASAVIGHHPHYLQGVEFHDGRPIFYSLGNIGAIARLKWSSMASAPECVLIPVLLNGHGEPEMAGRDTANRAFSLIARSSGKLNSEATLRFNGAIPEITINGR